MIGPFLMLLGALLMWVAVRGKADPMLNVIGVDAQRIQDNLGTMILTFITKDLAGAIGGAIQGALSDSLKGLHLTGPGGLALTYTPPAPIYIPNPTPGQPPLQVIPS